MATNHPKDEAYLTAVIPKRIRLFEQIQANQLEKLKSLPHDPIKVTLPDGNVKDGKKWETTPMDIAAQISKDLANSALISEVDDVLWDMSRPLEGDCKLEFFKVDSNKGRDTLWHSSAHILGQVLEQEYGCQLCLGPCTTREKGFYYDGFYGELHLNDNHFPKIEAGAAKAAKEAQPFERIEVTKDQALEMFSENNFKIEIINDLPADKTITVYRCGPLVDLCCGPHVPNTSFVKVFKCLRASSTYWRGNKDSESLQRVYGISYPDQKQKQLNLKDRFPRIKPGACSNCGQLDHTSKQCFDRPHKVGVRYRTAINPEPDDLEDSLGRYQSHTLTRNEADADLKISGSYVDKSLKTVYLNGRDRMDIPYYLLKEEKKEEEEEEDEKR